MLGLRLQGLRATNPTSGKGVVLMVVGSCGSKSYNAGAPRPADEQASGAARGEVGAGIVRNRLGHLPGKV